MKFLVCGLGSIGQRHIQNLRSLGQDDIYLLRSGLSTLDDRAFSDLPVEKDLSRAFDRFEPDAVIVSNPTALHLDLAIPAAEAGCHIFLEKPISHSLDRIKSLEEAIAPTGQIAFVGYQFRFHPGLRGMKHHLEANSIGVPLSIQSEWGEYLPHWHPWEDYRESYAARSDLGGGVLLTLSHTFDYLRWIFGEVRWVQAYAGQAGQLGIEVEDQAKAILGFQSGAIASVHLDYNQRPSSHSLRVNASAGSAMWDGVEDHLKVFRSEDEAWQIVSPPNGFERNTMFLDEMRHFIHLIEGREDNLCTLRDGIRALEITLAIKASAGSGKRIELSEWLDEE